MAKSKSAAPDSRVRGTDQLVSGEARAHMVAEAAYYRALNRDFNGGDPIDDWIAAGRGNRQPIPNAPQTIVALHLQ